MFVSAEPEGGEKKPKLLLKNRRVNSQLCLGSIRALKTTETKGEAGVKTGQVD